MRTNVEQLFTFNSSDFAHSSETIGIMCGSFFERVFRLHIEFASHLVTIVSFEIIIKGFVVATNTTADACSMSCKDGFNLRKITLYIEQSHTSCPFVEVSNYIFALNILKITNAFNNESSCMRECTCFIIIAISME